MTSTAAVDLATALGLVFVIEGLLLALLPEQSKRLVAAILALPSRDLRAGGLLSAALGLAILWLARG